jgi:hypothetical protein
LERKHKISVCVSLGKILLVHINASGDLRHRRCLIAGKTGSRVGGRKERWKLSTSKCRQWCGAFLKYLHFVRCPHRAISQDWHMCRRWACTELLCACKEGGLAARRAHGWRNSGSLFPLLNSDSPCDLGHLHTLLACADFQKKIALPGGSEAAEVKR